MLKKHGKSKAAGSAKGLRFGVVSARYNEELADSLLNHCVATLRAAGVRETDIRVLRVPGSFEVSAGAARLARRGRCDCVIGLGVLLEGQTRHAEVIAHAVADGLTQVAIEWDVPTVFGIVTANTLRQAQVRCLGTDYNRGREAALTALEMARLWKTK